MGHSQYIPIILMKTKKSDIISPLLIVHYMALGQETLRFKPSAFITPSELMHDVVERYRVYFGKDVPTKELYLLDASKFLSQMFRPHFTHYETPIAAIDGVYIPQLTEKKRGSFVMVDFTQFQNGGLNTATLLATSAALQGARISVAKKCDSWGIPQEQRPLRYEESFADKLRLWISEAGKNIVKTGFQNRSKATFYSALSEMMSIVLIDGDNPKEAFQYFMTKEKNDRGFGLYRAFFPRLASLLNEEAIYGFLNNNFKFEEVIRGFFREKSRTQVNTQLALEVAFLLQFPDDIKKNLLELSNTRQTLNIDLGLSIENIRQQIRLLSNSSQSFAPIPEKQIEEELPRPEQFGMYVNIQETELMRNYFGRKDARVVSPEQLRKNPAQFYEYQRALVLTIARNMKICIDPSSADSKVPIPQGYDEVKAKAFERIEHTLKETSDWVWLLLYPQVQEEFIKNLPYTRVPPYVLIDNKAVPLYDKERRQQVKEIVDKDPNRVINELPFLNDIVQSANKLGLGFNPSKSLTVIGQFLLEIIRNGGIPYIDHGIARWILGDWGSGFGVDTHGYSMSSPDDPNTAPKIDVDMLVLGPSNFVGIIAKQIVDKVNLTRTKAQKLTRQTLITGHMLARSMGKKIYTFITKQTEENAHVRRLITQDSYLAAHDAACFMQALEAWQAGDTPSNTKLLLEAIIGFSRLRSFGLIPEAVSDNLKEPNKGTISIAVKTADPLGGLIDYNEAGGGIPMFGLLRNVVKFIDLGLAFPKDQIFSVWHMLRTLSEFIYTTNGAVIFPEGVLNETYHNVDAVRAMKVGFAQLQPYLFQITDFLDRIRKGEIIADETIKQDLRQELSKTARGLIAVDLEKFLILCSNDSEISEKKAVMGIEMSRFFPHLDIIRKDYPGDWKKMLEKIRITDMAPQEKPLHFLARMLIEANPNILHIVKANIEEEFNSNPERIWDKLLESHGDEAKKSLYEHGYIKHGGWKFLDYDGVGKYAFVDRLWEYIFKFIKKNGYLSTEDLKDVTLIQHHSLRMSSYRSAQGFGMALKDTIRFEGRLARECQTQAMADWLIDSRI